MPRDAVLAAVEDRHDHDLVDHVPRVDEAGEVGDVAPDPGELDVDDLVDRQLGQPVGRHGVPAQRVALEPDAAVGEPARRGEDPRGVRPAADGLEAAPVERQRREVEQVEEGRGRPLGDDPGARRRARRSRGRRRRSRCRRTGTGGAAGRRRPPRPATGAPVASTHGDDRVRLADGVSRGPR